MSQIIGYLPECGFSIAVRINRDHPEMAATRRVLAEIDELLAARFEGATE